MGEIVTVGDYWLGLKSQFLSKLGTNWNHAPMPKRAQDLPLPALTLDAGSSIPLHRQIYFEIRGAILDGRLRPGTRLPASRALEGGLIA